MTLSAVFFDWVNTLVHMEPDRHIMCVETCRNHGIEIEPLAAARGIYAAEQQMPEGRPINWSEDTPADVFVHYNDIVLREAGVTPPDRATTLRIISEVRIRARDVRFVPYEDVTTALQSLKQRGLKVAVLSNMSRPITSFLERLGLSALVDFAITSSEVEGNGKPEPPIFLEALARAGVEPANVIYVGDEPFVDGVGASRVGISPVLIDRVGVYADFQDYERITNLDQLAELVERLA